MSLWYFIDLIQ